MRRFVRDGGLSLVFLAIFALGLIGQSIAGHAYNNQELAQHGQPPTPYLEFITSSDFLVDVAENWQSEFLQFFLFILATIWFIQRGSPESKKPGDDGVGSDADQLVGEHAHVDSPRNSRPKPIRTIVSRILATRLFGRARRRRLRGCPGVVTETVSVRGSGPGGGVSGTGRIVVDISGLPRSRRSGCRPSPG